jgi:hypothetical protein
MSSDERVYWQHALRTGQPSVLLPLLYPRLFALHDVTPQTQGLPGMSQGISNCYLFQCTGLVDLSLSCDYHLLLSASLAS